MMADSSHHGRRSLKRRRDEDNSSPSADEGSTPPVNREVVDFNRRVLQKLQRAFDRDPEVDLISQFPSKYAERLRLRSNKTEVQEKRPCEPVSSDGKPQIEGHVCPFVDLTCPIEIIHPLSVCIENLLAPSRSSNEYDLAPGLADILSKSQPIQKSPFSTTRAVLRCDSKTVVKVVYNITDYTEYTSLQFLDKHLAEFPAPKPLGVIRVGMASLIFASYIPGESLEEVWPRLLKDQKLSIMAQLETALSRLRCVARPADQPLGGVQGEGCKDFRRNARHSHTAIHTTGQYDDFLFSHARFGSNMYLDLLRKFSAKDYPVCFSHGDVRPDNIVVQKHTDGAYSIAGLVDWEFSGFYPSYYEATKATNCLSTDETSDWYQYLPPCLSPHHHAQPWLLDYVLDRLLE